MGFRIDSKQFYERVSSVSKVSAKSSNGLSFGNVRLRYDGSTLSLTGVSAKLCVTERVFDVPGDSKMDVVIDTTPMERVLKKLRKSELVIKQVGEMELVMEYDGGELRCVAGNPDVFPRIYDMPSDEPSMIDINMFKGVFSKAASFCKFDNDRPALGNVIMDVEGDNIFVIASDVSNMYRNKLANIDKIKDGRYYISGETAVSLDGYMRGLDGKVSMWFKDGRLYFHSEAVDLYESPYSGAFFNWKVLETDEPFTTVIRFNKKDMLDSLARCDASDMNTVIINVKDGEAHLEAENVLTSIKVSDKLPVEIVDGEPYDAIMGIDVLKRAVSCCLSDKVTLRRRANRRYIIVSPEDNDEERMLSMECAYVTERYKK